MNETEWMVSNNPMEMLEALLPPRPGHHASIQADSWRGFSYRKLRLWVSALTSRAHRNRPTHPCHSHAWTRGEAPGTAPHEESFTPVMAARFWAARSNRYDAPPEFKARLLRCVLGNPYRPVKIGTLVTCPSQMSTAALESGAAAEWFPPSWLTTTIVSPLVQAAYLDRRTDGSLDPDRLLVLADALEDAGLVADQPCTRCKGPMLFQLGQHCIRDEKGNLIPCPTCQGTGRSVNHDPDAILTHLRGPGLHCRGCWVLDLLLGLE